MQIYKSILKTLNSRLEKLSKCSYVLLRRGRLRRVRVEYDMSYARERRCKNYAETDSAQYIINLIIVFRDSQHYKIYYSEFYDIACSITARFMILLPVR